jgi:hypothetical protein
MEAKEAAKPTEDLSVAKSFHVHPEDWPFIKEIMNLFYGSDVALHYLLWPIRQNAKDWT